jgi:hypothetical protein
MRINGGSSSTWWRRLARAAIAALGVLTIVGSGGGMIGFPDIDFGGPYPPLPPSARVEPSRVTVQVGATVAFTVNTIGGAAPFSYQWRRNGVDIAGANGTTYKLVGVDLGDDSAQFEARVTAGNGVATATSILRVSPLPGVVYQDNEFLASDWAATAIADPAQGGPTYTASQSAPGGNPDAFRSIAYQMTPGPSAITVFQTMRSATYDPAAQGPIYTIDLAQDCNNLTTSALQNETVSAKPMFEQGGRRFAPRQWSSACQHIWLTARGSSMRADEFEVVAGPACGADEACPDFSVGAAPIRFGFVSGVNLPLGKDAGAITQGIDNWTVTVWRR